MNGEGEGPQFQPFSFGNERGLTRGGLSFLPFEPDIPLEEIYATIAAGILANQGPIVNGVGDDTSSMEQASGDIAVVPVIDPEFETTTTVYEEAPGGIYDVDRAPTDWDAVYDQYVILNQPEVPVPVFQEPVPPRDAPVWQGSIPGKSQEESDVALDWGEIIGGALGTMSTQFIGPQQAPGPMSYVAAPPPARVTVDTRTGKVTACKRRRRRKLLTESDFNVLLRVATLPAKENVRIVLGKAIGRG